MIPYGRQDILEEDIEAVQKVLTSDFLTQGPAITDFEEALGREVGSNHVTAYTSATAALHAAYDALGITKGSLVWTSPNTFVSTANAAVMLGADIDFVDIDLETYNMCVQKLHEKLIEAKKRGRLPDLVVPVHFSGQSCDMEKIGQLAKEFGFKVVEDASHAVGGRYKDRPVGSCDHSDITVFSFHPVKIITTGEGGATTTNDPDLDRRMKSFRTHGITRDVNLMDQTPDGPWYYQMLHLGYNYRITDIQAALGLSQLQRLHEYIKKRHEVAAFYDEHLASFGLGLPAHMDWQYSARHLYVIQWPEGLGGHNRLSGFKALREYGIGVNVHYIPVNAQPFYKKFGFSEIDFPNAKRYYDQTISLPMYPGLNTDQLEYIADTLSKLTGNK